MQSSRHPEERVPIPSTKNASLETRIYSGGARKETCVILAHPYGPLGGNLNNNVVEALFRNFAEKGFMTVRFNFRGVGGSTGHTSLRGKGEQEDVLSVCKYVVDRPSLAPKKILLCGYSYGSIATSAVASKIPELAGIIFISYPSGVLWFLTMFNGNACVQSLRAISPQIPKLFLHGGRDNFTSKVAFTKLVDSLPTVNRTCVVLPDDDHFFVGKESSLIGHVNQWLSKSGI
ncbi:Alpha/Beta hydrolase protein [Gaertneriomyces semiglobifer]|nr:Alpha/Beta hydrolase protein [Gaertneriomyces semiglobifer]